MIDWFVLLIPLVLLPIFALFVFIGCVLDQEGKGKGNGVSNESPIVLHYQPYVNVYVESVNIVFTFKETMQTSPAIVFDIIHLTDFDESGGDETVGLIPYESEGTIAFMGSVKMAGQANSKDLGGIKNKAKNEPAPGFTLDTSGSVF